MLGHFDEDEGGELIDEDYSFDRATLFDEKHADYKHVSTLSFGIDRIPEKFLTRAHKIFSKH